MNNSVATLLVLMIIFAAIALIPGFAKAALGMAIGALCWPFVSKVVEIMRGQDGE